MDNCFQVEDKYLKVMADYCAEGLWTRSGSISPYDIPLSDDLREKLVAWNWWYDMGYDVRMLEQNVGSEFDLAEFVAQGLDLARQLKRELPDWHIYYFDEAECARAFKFKQDTGQEFCPNRRLFEILL